jgi:membrane fusion protein (multidrug efflux system)
MNDLRKFVLIITMCVIGALTLLGLWWSFYGGKGGLGLDREPIAVEVEKVRLGSIIKRVNVVGTLVADNEVVIHPEVEGKIKKLDYKEGSLVKAGDPLVQIEDDIFKAKVKEADAKYKFAKLELDRYSKLTEQSAGPLKKKEESQANVLQSEAALDMAQLQLDHTIIRAPFSGYIGLKEFSIGAFIDPRTELLTIVDVDPITVDYRVPATYLRSISQGQEVKVTIDSYPDQLFKATIGAVDPRIDPLANSVQVRAYIPNPDGKLKPGLFARVNMVVGSNDNALLLPESSVLTGAEESFVYQVRDVKIKDKETKIALKRPVVTGMSESGVIEILKGLSEGDMVISVGLNKVQEQSPVRIVEDVEAEEKFDEEVNDVAKDSKAAKADGSEKPADETEDKQSDE